MFSYAHIITLTLTHCGEQLHRITRSLWRAVTYNHQVVVESSYI